MCTIIPPDLIRRFLRRTVVVHRHVPEAPVQGLPLLPHGRKIRPLGEGAPVGGQRVQRPQQVVDPAVLVQGVVVFRGLHHTAAGEEDLAGEGPGQRSPG